MRVMSSFCSAEIIYQKGSEQFFSFGLFAIKRKSAHRGKIVEREEHRVFCARRVGMRMRRPGGQVEDVLLLPVEALVRDHRPAATLGHLVDHAAGMAVRSCLLFRL